MKLLFDENISPKLPRLIPAVFAGSEHVRELGLKGQTDEAIWSHARTNGFTLVSKDSDFHQRALFYGAPPKFIWLRLGNCTRDDLLALLLKHEPEILAFESSNETVLVLW
jgi:predicted nuclease of predicted toxin-antitoxin system